jgi:hypothetical protein
MDGGELRHFPEDPVQAKKELNARRGKELYPEESPVDLPGTDSGLTQKSDSPLKPRRFRIVTADELDLSVSNLRDLRNTIENPEPPKAG